MQAVHHPDLPRAITVTVIGAVLAIVLTLALATGLGDLAPTPAPTSTAGKPLALKAPASSPAWAQSPFTRLLSAPVVVPWAPTRR